MNNISKDEQAHILHEDELATERQLADLSFCCLVALGQASSNLLGAPSLVAKDLPTGHRRVDVKVACLPDKVVPPLEILFEEVVVAGP